MSDECDGKRNSSDQRHSRSQDHRIGRIADDAHGVISVDELLAVGLTRDHIAYRRRIGRLHPVHPRVYAVATSRLSREGWLMAAIKYAGADALISHRSAASLLGLLGWRERIHVTVTKRPRGRRNLALHQGFVPPDERDAIQGIPCTGLARTLLDLAATEGGKTLERAMREARFRRLTGRLSLPALIDRYPGHRGVMVARAVLAERAFALGRHRSELEDAFSEFCRARGITLPETNAMLEVEGRWFEIDCLWRNERLALELDSRSAHDDDESFDRDRERDLILMSAGWRTGRVTWRHIHRAPGALERRIRTALGRGAGLTAP